MNEQKSRLNIRSKRAYQAAHELSRLTGQSLTATVVSALEERLERWRPVKSRGPYTGTRQQRIAALLDLGRRFSELALSSTATPDEILGYDENGLPT